MSLASNAKFCINAVVVKCQCAFDCFCCFKFFSSLETFQAILNASNLTYYFCVNEINKMCFGGLLLFTGQVDDVLDSLCTVYICRNCC